jgi:hypothetical protein
LLKVKGFVVHTWVPRHQVDQSALRAGQATPTREKRTPGHQGESRFGADVPFLAVIASENGGYIARDAAARLPGRPCYAASPGSGELRLPALFHLLTVTGSPPSTSHRTDLRGKPNGGRFERFIVR